MRDVGKIFAKIIMAIFFLSEASLYEGRLAANLHLLQNSGTSVYWKRCFGKAYVRSSGKCDIRNR